MLFPTDEERKETCSTHYAPRRSCYTNAVWGVEKCNIRRCSSLAAEVGGFRSITEAAVGKRGNKFKVHGRG